MSTRGLRHHFQDILDSIAKIERFTFGMRFEAFASNDEKQSAVERQLQIITEAAFRLGDEAELYAPGPDWAGMRGMGNFLRHAYHMVSEETVWRVVTEDLPILKQASTQALKKVDI